MPSEPTIKTLATKLAKMEVKLKDCEKKLKDKKPKNEDKQTEEHKPKELNKFFKKLKQAKDKGVNKFVYKGQTYKKSTASTGLIVYKKQ